MNPFAVQLKRLPHSEGLPLPAYQSDQAAGFDLIAAVKAEVPVTIAPGERAMIPTGICIALPQGTEGQVRPRSGLAHRHGVTVLNAPGTIDADYRGEICVLLINHGKEPFPIRRGERIAQLVISQVTMATLEQADKLSITDRNEGGFGSTGVR